uniref:Uncharacterized protein n=1 Tax=Arion vulgaris TaxID=1028688 RepID=A0A0B7AQF8_9EUPU
MFWPLCENEPEYTSCKSIQAGDPLDKLKIESSKGRSRPRKKDELIELQTS